MHQHSCSNCTSCSFLWNSKLEYHLLYTIVKSIFGQMVVCGNNKAHYQCHITIWHHIYYECDTPRLQTFWKLFHQNSKIYKKKGNWQNSYSVLVNFTFILISIGRPSTLYLELEIARYPAKLAITTFSILLRSML